MKVTSYVFLSLIAECCMIYYAYYTQRQFYPTILFLVSSKLSLLTTGNLLVSVSLMVARLIQYLFFGNLRVVEMELLVEKAKYAFIETCLALTIFRLEITASIIALFTFLIFVKLLHKLSKLRLEYLEQIAEVSLYMQIRMSCLLLSLLVVDGLLVFYAAQSVLSKGRSVLILFGFEFGLLLNYAANLLIRFGIQVIDSRLANGFQSRGFCIMLVDLSCEVVKLVTYVTFFSLIFMYYGLPIHLVRDLYAAYHSFHRKFVGLVKYLRLTRNMESRFPDASPAEVSSAGSCLVCREDMDHGKKLPCGHVFHVNCLRMWLQHQQACPLCRADIPSPEEDLNVNNSTEPVNNNEGNGNVAQAPVLAEGPPPSPAGHEDIGIVPLTESQNISDFDWEEVAAQLPDISFANSSSPRFYVVISTESITVHKLPVKSSPAIRTVNRGTVLFMSTQLTGIDGNNWLKAPDGWVCEYFVLNGIKKRRLIPLVKEEKELTRRQPSIKSTSEEPKTQPTQHFYPIIKPTISPPSSPKVDAQSVPVSPPQSMKYSREQFLKRFDSPPALETIVKKEPNTIAQEVSNISSNKKNELVELQRQMSKISHTMEALNDAMILCQKAISRLIEEEENVDNAGNSLKRI